MKAFEKPLIAGETVSWSYLPILSVLISQTPPALGDAVQAVSIELLESDRSGKIIARFAGVQNLKLSTIDPGIPCGLTIVNVKADQMEGIHYQVFNGEQDFTLSFYCRDFSVEEAALAFV